MIKKLLNNLYNMSLDQIEEISLSLWYNIREVLFADENESKNNNETKKVGG